MADSVRLIVLITDGEDNGSLALLPETIRAQEAEAVIYAMHYEDAALSYGTGKHVLDLMSDRLGAAPP